MYIYQTEPVALKQQTGLQHILLIIMSNIASNQTNPVWDNWTEQKQKELNSQSTFLSRFTTSKPYSVWIILKKNEGIVKVALKVNGSPLQFLLTCVDFMIVNREGLLLRFMCKEICMNI